MRLLVVAISLSSWPDAGIFISQLRLAAGEERHLCKPCKEFVRCVDSDIHYVLLHRGLMESLAFDREEVDAPRKRYSLFLFTYIYEH